MSAIVRTLKPLANNERLDQIFKFFIVDNLFFEIEISFRIRKFGLGNLPYQFSYSEKSTSPFSYLLNIKRILFGILQIRYVSLDICVVN